MSSCESKSGPVTGFIVWAVFSGRPGRKFFLDLLYRSFSLFSSTTAIPDAGCVFFSTGGWIFQIRKNAFMVKCGQPVRGQLARFAVRRYTQGPAGIGRIELLCGI